MSTNYGKLQEDADFYVTIDVSSTDETIHAALDSLRLDIAKLVQKWLEENALTGTETSEVCVSQ